MVTRRRTEQTREWNVCDWNKWPAVKMWLKINVWYLIKITENVRSSWSAVEPELNTASGWRTDMNHSSALEHSSGGNSSAWFLLNRAEQDQTGLDWAEQSQPRPRSSSFISLILCLQRISFVSSDWTNQVACYLSAEAPFVCFCLVLQKKASATVT